MAWGTEDKSLKLFREAGLPSHNEKGVMVHTDAACCVWWVSSFHFLFFSGDTGGRKGPGGLVAETVMEPFQYKPLRFCFVKLF